MGKSSIAAIAELPPDYDIAAVRRLLLDEYGLEGRTSNLVSERDQNLAVTTAAGERFVLKITSAAEDPRATEFQVSALLHLEGKSLDVGVPRIRRTIAGAATTSIDEHPVRLVGYVPGSLMSEAALSPELASRFGVRLAQLGAALRDYERAESGQPLLWDMRRAPELRDIVAHIDDVAMQELVDEVLDEFERVAKPAFTALRQQVIHNDANPANVLVDAAASDVTGFIDFGDMILAPLVIDIAVAAAYLRAETGNELRLIAPFISAYHAVTPLRDSELALLYTLVRTRLATTIAILYWRLADRAPSDPYRQQSLESEADAGAFLQALSKMGREEFTNALLVG